MLSPIFVAKVAEANITGRPSAPAQPIGNTSTTGVVVVPAPSGLTVSWGEPLSNANLVNGYQVEYSTDGITWTVATNSLSSATYSYTISGLSSSTKYYVRVAAKTSSGLGAYGYPWTLVYETSQPHRTSSAIVYSTNKSSELGSTSTNFTRVRYEMTRTVNTNDTKRVYADFNKTLSNSLTSCGGGSCTPSDLNSIGNLQVPAPATGANIFVGGEVEDLSIYSDDTSKVTNGHGFVGRVELFPRNYATALPASYNSSQSGISAGSGSIYDIADTPYVDGDYGSFQLHNVTSGSSQTVFAWNRHTSSSTYEIGFGSYTGSNSSVGTDWTFCRGNSICGAVDSFNLKILANIPINAGCALTSDTTSSPGFTILKFTSTGSCSWTVPSGVTTADVLVVGGGGGGGGGSRGSNDGGRGGGGGGAGGVATSLTGTSLTAGTSVTIEVGAGGSGGAANNNSGGYGSSGTQGGSSKFGSTTSNGGNAGTSQTGELSTNTAGDGGSNGSYSGGSNSWEGAGGGAGAGANGSNGSDIGGIGGNGGKGGNGSTSSISGTSTTYGGGGGGGGTSGNTSSLSGSAGSGGTGGGGAGAIFGSTPVAGEANLGAGGGGGSGYSSSAKPATSGAAGGSGIVIVKYLNAPSITLSSTTITGNIGTVLSGYTITNSGGSVTSYSISPAFSVGGLTFSTSTGRITGTPTSVSSSTTYTLTATNANGSSTATFTLSTSYEVCVPNSTSVSGGTLLTFTSRSICEWTLPNGLNSIEVLAVGGGGGGGADGGSGGGGGELRYSANYSVTSLPKLAISIGAGGTGGSWSAGTAATAGASTFVKRIDNTTLFEAKGGAGGKGYRDTSSISGGSGGSGGSGTSGQVGGLGPSGDCPSSGNKTIGSSPSGSAPSNSITGSSVNYGGGGGGGSHYFMLNGGSSNLGAAGGGTSGGRGASYKLGRDGNSTNGSSRGSNGTANTGGGGGAGSACDAYAAQGATFGSNITIDGIAYTSGQVVDGRAQRTNGGDGADGVVIIKYLNAPSISLSSSVLSGSVGNAISGYTVTNTGGTVSSFSISPSLPAGVTFNTSTGEISGTPTEGIANTTFTVTATNGGGNSTATFTLAVVVLNIAITVPPSIAAPSATTEYAFSGISVTNLNPAKTYLVSIGLSGEGSSGALLKMATTTNLTVSYGYTNTNVGGGKDLRGGFTNISFTVSGANQTQLNTNLNTLKYASGNGTGAPSVTITVTENTIADIAYNPTNGHYYLAQTGGSFVGLTWSQANTQAKALTYLGQPGYLVTITTASERDFVFNNIAGASKIWIGATDSQTEGLWKWASNGGSPEAGLRFWRANCVDASTFVSTCSDSGTYSSSGANVTVDGIDFSNWSSGEPNNYVASGTSEDYAVANWVSSSSTWNDLRDISYSEVAGYVVEFGTNAPGNGFVVGSASTTSSPILINTTPAISYTGSPFTYTRGTAITPITPANAGGAVSSYSISPTLPAGLVFNTSSGQISGTATETRTTTTYTITATGAGSTSNTTISITVVPPSYSYSISFTANGGSGSMSTLSGLASSVSLTANSFTRAGYTFAGWRDIANNLYTDEQLFLINSAVTITLSAQWTPIPLTITYLPNNATSGNVPVDNKTYTMTETATVLGNPNNLQRTGYTFGGWALNSGGTGTIYSSGVAYTLGETNVSFHAKWNANTYSITYNRNGATGDPQRLTDSYTTANPGITLPTVGSMARNGYNFGGWSTSPSGSAIVGAYSPTQNETLYAVWNIKTITITYNKGSASSASFNSFPTTSSGAFNTTVTLPTPDSTTVTFSSNTYKFLGWYDGTNTFVAGTSFLLPANDLTLTASWVLLLEVRYVLNGGSFTGGRSDTTDSECTTSGNRCIESQQIQLDTAPTRTGYDFTGWRNANNTILQAGDTQTVTSTSFLFQAQWNAIPRTIQYSPNNGDSTPIQSSLSINQSFTVANAITRNGYSFVGWMDGNSEIYGPGSTYIVGNTNVLLTAQWNPNTYEVNYDWNGGQGSATNSDTYTVSVSNPIPLPGVGDHVKDGFNFGGWSLTPGGSNVGVTFVPTESTTLYAVWTQGSYVITKNFNWTGQVNSSESISQGSSVVLGKPTRQNFVFTGWYDSPTSGNLVNDGIASFTPTRSRTLYARWIQASLYGISPTSLFNLYTANIVNGTSIDTTVTNSQSQVRIVVPAGALPADTVFKVDLVGDFTRARNRISIDNSYILSVVVSWLSPGDLVPDTESGTAISITLNNSQIKTGATIYKIIGEVVTVLGVATQDGTATVNITSDPEVLVAITKPAAPTAVTATNGQDARSTISWTLSSSDGGSPITGYTATSSGGQFCNTTGAISNSCEVTGLTNGTPYTFTVKATNSIGDSPASSASNSITPRAPGPQVVTWTPITSLVMTQTPHTPSSLATSEGGGSITYAVESAGTTGCTVDSSTAVMIFTAVGSCSVSATAAAVGNFLSDSTTVIFNISLASRSLTIDSSSFDTSYYLTDTPPTITATASAGTGSKTFSSSSPTICSIDSSSGLVTFNAVGNCQIGANISATSIYESATATTISFTISEFIKGTQVITWSPNTSILVNASPHTPSTSATSSGTGAITYSVFSAGTTGCAVNSSNGVITFTAAGSCSIKATAAANNAFLEGSRTVTFIISKLNQTVSWSPLTNVLLNQSPLTPSVLASTSGTGSISYSVLTSGTTACTVNSNTGVITFTGTGACTIKAIAAENGTYLESSTNVTFTITAPASTGGGASNVTPTPTATPTATPTPTPTPTPSASPSPSQSPSPTSSPTSAPNPNPNPGGTSGGTSGGGSGGSSGGNSGATPKPTPKPSSSATPKPNSPITLDVVKPERTLANGEILTLQNGNPISATVRSNKNREAIVISGDKWSLAISALNANNRILSLLENGELNSKVRGKFRITGSGALPNSEVRIYLLANVRVLESFRSDKDGEFAKTIQLPQRVTQGLHTIQINSQISAKQIRSVSYGFNVGPAGEGNTSSGVKPRPTASPSPTASQTKSPSPTPSASNLDFTSAIPFKGTRIRVGSEQLSEIRKLDLSGKSVEISIVGYVKSTGTRDDLRISLDRALEVRKAIAKIAPNAKLIIRGEGGKAASECRSLQNNCVTVKVSKG